MTFEEFKRKHLKKNSFDKYWYYSLCVIVILLSLAGFYFALTNPEELRGFNYFFYACCAFLLLLGLAGFRLLPKRYKIVEVPSYLTLDKKKALTKRLLEEISMIPYYQPDQYVIFKLKSKFWQSGFTVHFFFDETKFAYSVQGHDVQGGFIDFGGTERKRKMIASKIEELSLEMSYPA